MRFATIIVRNVLRRKMRSLLTVTGVALAIAAVVSLLGVSSGFTTSLMTMYQSRGVDLVVVRAGVADRLTSSLDEELGKRIAALPQVKHVAGSLTEVSSFPIRGWNADSFAFDHLPIVKGRKLEAGDQKAVVVGVDLAKDKHLKLGDTLEVETYPFKVIGIFDNQNPIENSSVVMLLSDLQELMDRPNQVTEFQVATVTPDADDQNPVEEVRHAIESMTDDEGRSLRLAAMPTQEFVSSTTQLRLAKAMAWMTSVIALLIGGVGILNTMIMSVLERTQEIGVLRSLGWRRSRIVRLILGESMLLTLLGAALGTVLAIGLTNLLIYLSVVPDIVEGDFSPQVLLTGLAMALLVGVFGGLYPAWRGANLPPTEALRYE
jgi:putative ABC transport system permease protein